MTLQTSGAISLADIQTEFGGDGSISLSEYYAGGSYVPAGTNGYPGNVSTAIPSSGAISFSNFYGASKRIKQLYVITASGYFQPAAGMTDVQILLVGGGGRGGPATVVPAEGGYASGGGGGAGQVILLNNITLPATQEFPLPPVNIVIGAGSNTAEQGGATQIYYYPNFVNSGTLVYQAVGGYSGERGSFSNGYSSGGSGGASGNGFSGEIGLESMGGGGGGATGRGINDEPGPPYTIVIGGTTFTKGTGGGGDASSLTGPNNSGNGGGGAVRTAKGTSVGYAGGSGVVIIYG